MGCDFGTYLAPFSLPTSSKILPKTDPKSGLIFDRFQLRIFIDFGSVLKTKMEPCGPTFSSQDGPRGLQDAPKGLQETPRRLSRRAWLPESAQTPYRHRCSSIFDRFLVDFRSIFVRLYIDFSWIFDRFLIDFLISILIDFRIDSWLKKIGSMLFQPSACSAGGAAPPQNPPLLGGYPAKRAHGGGNAALLRWSSSKFMKLDIFSHIIRIWI